MIADGKQRIMRVFNSDTKSEEVQLNKLALSQFSRFTEDHKLREVNKLQIPPQNSSSISSDSESSSVSIVSPINAPKEKRQSGLTVKSGSAIDSARQFLSNSARAKGTGPDFVGATPATPESSSSSISSDSSSLQGNKSKQSVLTSQFGDGSNVFMADVDEKASVFRKESGNQMSSGEKPVLKQSEAMYNQVETEKSEEIIR